MAQYEPPFQRQANRTLPICNVELQAEPPVQHVRRFADAGLERDRLRLTLKTKTKSG